MKDLKGRTAIVTGASRGIGVFVARALAGEGMNLVLAARSHESLESLAAELRATGTAGAMAVPADVTRLEELRRLVDETGNAFGEISVLVNNAGIEKVFSYHRLTAAEIDEVIDVNLRAAMRLTWLVLPGMLERRRGHIVNMSSLAGRAGPAFSEPYAATKAALVGFTQSLRGSYREQGVSASVVCPGFVETGMYTVAKQESGLAAPRTLGVSTPEAVAAAVVRAIRRDLPDVIVNPMPVRPLLGAMALAPGLAERVSRFIDANRLFREVAGLRERRREREEEPAGAKPRPRRGGPSDGGGSRRRGTSRSRP